MPHTFTHTLTQMISMTMEKRIAVFTIFTFLLFAVSTARIAFNPISIPTDDESKYSMEAIPVADSNVALPTEKLKSDLIETNANDRLPEIQTFFVSSIDPMARKRLARSNQINRHFYDKTSRIPLRFVRRHPCRKFHKTVMIPRNKLSYGNDVILSDKTTSFELESLGDQVPMKWLEFKHKYGHRHHHHHDKQGEFEIKNKIDRDELDSISGNHKEKKREHRGGFMRRIRKFLKHTFD